MVADGARVSVVARAGRGSEHASLFRLALVFRAVVQIVARKRSADALAVYALVVLRAEALIVAGAFQHRMKTPSLRGIAQVNCAGAVVLAGFFINLGIAVVVHAVAYLRTGQGGRAVGKALRRAHALAGALPELVFDVAFRGHSQLDRYLGTGADSCGVYALLGRTGGAVNRIAVESVGAVAVVVALSAAEAPLLPILDTDILDRQLRGCASGVRFAWKAEVDIVGNADEHGVRTACRLGLAARPAVRAFLYTVDGANLVPHALHTPSGQAVRVVLARLAEISVIEEFRFDVCNEAVETWSIGHKVRSGFGLGNGFDFRSAVGIGHIR